MERFTKVLIGVGVICFLTLPACARVKRAAAISGAAVQHGTAKVEHGADRAGDKLRSGMDKTADKLEVVGEKIDRTAKKVGEKLPE